jgi:hypothetical protein
MTFTDDFTVSAWIKLTSYVQGTIASRYDGTSGWIFDVNSSGQFRLIGYNAGAANNSSLVQSYQTYLLIGGSTLRHSLICQLLLPPP